MNMINFKYTDTSSWEWWQKVYKYGSFFIFPPKGIIEPIDELRQKYDPESASYCQAHISLSEPLKSPLTEDQLQELKSVLSSMEPFEIHYGPLRSFPPYPGVTYAIQPEDKFMKLRSLVHSTFIFKDTPLKHAHIAPHMTIAEFITLKRTNQLLKELTGNVPEGIFLCDSIEYAVPNSDFSFERILTIPIGNESYKVS